MPAARLPVSLDGSIRLRPSRRGDRRGREQVRQGHRRADGRSRRELPRSVESGRRIHGSVASGYVDARDRYNNAVNAVEQILGRGPRKGKPGAQEAYYALFNAASIEELLDDFFHAAQTEGIGREGSRRSLCSQP